MKRKMIAHIWSHSKQGVCHTVGVPFTLKGYVTAKEELWKLKYLTMQKYNLYKFL
jgi:hypothetical protein